MPKRGRTRGNEVEDFLQCSCYNVNDFEEVLQLIQWARKLSFCRRCAEHSPPTLPKAHSGPILPAHSPQRDGIPIFEERSRIHSVQQNLLFTILCHFQQASTIRRSTRAANGT
jgi:hypothetical protein